MVLFVCWDESFVELTMEMFNSKLSFSFSFSFSKEFVVICNTMIHFLSLKNQSRKKPNTIPVVNIEKNTNLSTFSLSTILSSFHYESKAAIHLRIITLTISLMYSQIFPWDLLHLCSRLTSSLALCEFNDNFIWSV